MLVSHEAQAGPGLEKGRQVLSHHAMVPPDHRLQVVLYPPRPGGTRPQSIEEGVLPPHQGSGALPAGGLTFGSVALGRSVDVDHPGARQPVVQAPPLRPEDEEHVYQPEDSADKGSL